MVQKVPEIYNKQSTGKVLSRSIRILGRGIRIANQNFCITFFPFLGHLVAPNSL